MSNFKGLKPHPIHDFRQKKTFHVKKQSPSFQNMFSKLLCPCWTSFLQSNLDKPLRNSRSLDMTRVTWKSCCRLDCVTQTWHKAIISDLCGKNQALTYVLQVCHWMSRQSRIFFLTMQLYRSQACDSRESIKPQNVNIVFPCLFWFNTFPPSW